MPNTETPRHADLLRLTYIDGVVRIELDQDEVSKLTADEFITLLGSLEAVKHKVYALSEVAYDDSDHPDGLADNA